MSKHQQEMSVSEAVEIAKDEGLTYLSLERERIMRMSHDEALNEILKISKIENKIVSVKSIKDSGLFKIQ